ncbi:MAG: hypothetical protein EBX35_05475 [Planctomycetia bacterium]|nr:hypothetical protein [Planctomycetia bacterium]
MSVAAIVFLAIVSLLLLTALVSFGVGHKRWSWVSVVASFLVTLSLTGYLYLAARLLQFEWRWVQTVRATQVRIDEVRDAMKPAGDPRDPGPLEKIEGAKSLVELRQERDRWRRALERISNWRGRHWDKASFRPPEKDGDTGTIELPPPETVADEGAGAVPDPAADPAAGGEAAPAAARPAGVPLDPGATVYVFDETPAKEGGLYLGAFRVAAVAGDDATGRLTLTVTQTAPSDAYDRQAWSRAYDAVTVYDTLPADRWLAFSETSRAAGPDGVAQQIAPQPAKKSEEDLADLVPEPFRADVERHALSAADARDQEVVEEADWPALREALDNGERLPGEAWAEFEFKDLVDFDTFLKIERGDGPEPESLAAEVELGKAFELADEGKGTLRKVFYRRRLIDAETEVHGSVVAGGQEAAEVMTNGLAALMRGLQQDIAALDAASERLTASQTNVAAEQAVVRGQAEELAADLASWERDGEAATQLADAFETEAAQAAKRLEEAEREVVKLGRELDALIGRTVRAIDRVAPPPPGGRRTLEEPMAASAISDETFAAPEPAIHVSRTRSRGPGKPAASTPSRPIGYISGGSVHGLQGSVRP